jgi:hypothetical protein
MSVKGRGWQSPVMVDDAFRHTDVSYHLSVHFSRVQHRYPHINT